MYLYYTYYIYNISFFPPLPISLSLSHSSSSLFYILVVPLLQKIYPRFPTSTIKFVFFIVFLLMSFLPILFSSSPTISTYFLSIFLPLFYVSPLSFGALSVCTPLFIIPSPTNSLTRYLFLLLFFYRYPFFIPFIYSIYILENYRKQLSQTLAVGNTIESLLINFIFRWKLKQNLRHPPEYLTGEFFRANPIK